MKTKLLAGAMALALIGCSEKRSDASYESADSSDNLDVVESAPVAPARAPNVGVTAAPGVAFRYAYAFRLDEVSTVRGPNYVAARGHISVTRDGKSVTTLYPERRIYTVQEQVMTEAAIDPGITRDLYVSLGDPLGGDAWLIKLQHKPFVDWIWGGCLVMALGGLLAASDRRYRFTQKKRIPVEVAA